MHVILYFTSYCFGFSKDTYLCIPTDSVSALLVCVQPQFEVAERM